MRLYPYVLDCPANRSNGRSGVFLKDPPGAVPSASQGMGTAPLSSFKPPAPVSTSDARGCVSNLISTSNGTHCIRLETIDQLFYRRTDEYI